MAKISIEISARHIHLSQEHLEKVFGQGYELRKLRELSQKGEFASKERVAVKMGGGEFPRMRVLGPVREQTQIEVSATDAHKLGACPPVRLSGDLKGSAGAQVIGPRGKVKLREGVIIAKRHIHASPKEAKKYGLKNGQKVSVKVKGARGLTFHEVVVRVDEDFRWGLHVDVDEANGAGVGEEGVGEVII